MGVSRMIKILPYTTKEPLQMIGYCAGICWNSDVSDPSKNIDRALDCINSGHTRTAEFPDVYCIIDGYSARCIRELYTHIVGTTRLQESTRYVNCDGFDYYDPTKGNDRQTLVYNQTMTTIRQAYKELIEAGMSKEDAANILPLGMSTKIVWKINLRALIHFMNERLCNRAYKEIRALSNELKSALIDYSTEWSQIAYAYFYPKCVGSHCKEKHPCKQN